MKKLFLMLLLAVFSVGTFAQTNPQDTTKRKKHKTSHPKQKTDTLKRDTSKSWPKQTDTTRKKY